MNVAERETERGEDKERDGEAERGEDRERDREAEREKPGWKGKKHSV